MIKYVAFASDRFVFQIWLLYVCFGSAAQLAEWLSMMQSLFILDHILWTKFAKVDNFREILGKIILILQQGPKVDNFQVILVKYFDATIGTKSG